MCARRTLRSSSSEVATAYPHRDSSISTSYATGWARPEDEARRLAWLRNFYRDVCSETGGVPVAGEIANGATINHPDVDLADPEWNTSGVPWHTLYFRNTYARLQRANADGTRATSSIPRFRFPRNRF